MLLGLRRIRAVFYFWNNAHCLVRNEGLELSLSGWKPDVLAINTNLTGGLGKIRTFTLRGLSSLPLPLGYKAWGRITGLNCDRRFTKPLLYHWANPASGTLGWTRTINDGLEHRYRSVRTSVCGAPTGSWTLLLWLKTICTNRYAIGTGCGYRNRTCLSGIWAPIGH